MSITSIGSSSAASQAAWISKFDNANSTGAAGQAHRPPPPPDGGAMLGALADALQSIGVTATGAADDGSAAGSSTGATGSDSNVAQALGGFLHELMGALHAQGGAQGGSQSGTPPDGQAYGPPGGPGGPGGPGRLSSDLQSLISELGGSTSDTSSTGGTDATDATSASDSVASLESSFKNLLQALGSDTSNAEDKLSSFLQTLADKLPGAGTSGNLVNTTV